MSKENSVKSLTSPSPALPFFVLLVFVLFFFCAPIAFAQTNTKKDTPLHVTSDKMIALKDTSMVEFIGNVKATRDDTVIFADSIKIFIHTAETKKEGQTDLRQIIATGNVEYTAGERKAFADKAVYTTQDEILILTGETARLITGKSHVTGKKITLFRNEDRAIVESDGETRVQAVFNPEDQKPETKKPNDLKPNDQEKGTTQ